MKKIAVFFNEPGSTDYPFNKPEYLSSYQILDSEISKLGAEFFIVRSNDTYEGNGVFTKSWRFESGKIIEAGKLVVDSLYDKGGFVSDNTINVLNREEVNEICTNKWKTYNVFKEFCPKTIVANTKNEFILALKEIPGDRKVIKPVDGEEGRGVYIGENQYLLEKNKTFPVLVQEFLDTSEGIPNIYVGIHDLRVVYINGEIIYSFYRTPPPGKLLANVAQGGQLTVVDKADLPKEVFFISDKVRESFKNDYCFSVDLGFVKGVPKIIELNSRPAVFHPDRGEEFLTFIKKIAHVLTHPTT
ncbi:MAG: ATP-grasp domain-containing protein [Patescibacteria group bacterium]